MDTKCESPAAVFDLAAANALQLDGVRKIRDDSLDVGCRISVVLGVELDVLSRVLHHIGAVLEEFGWYQDIKTKEWHYQSGSTLYIINVTHKCSYAPYGEQNGGIAIVELCYSMVDLYEEVQF